MIFGRRMHGHGGRGIALGVAVLLAACRSASPPTAADGLDRALAELLARPELAGGRVGVCVVDGATGASLLAHEADRGFATASNMKLVTAAVALTTLGADHTVATELWQRGTVDEHGTLGGDLVLRGHGDPTLGVGLGPEATWAPFVAALRERGVRRVTGRVLADDSWLGDERLGQGWQWDYLDEDYAAPFGALCCHHNCVEVRVRVRVGAVSVELVPPVLPQPRVAAQLAPAGSPTRLQVRRALGSEHVDVRGTLAIDGGERTFLVTVPDPAVATVRSLELALGAAGIPVAGETVSGAAAQSVLLHAHRSPPFGVWLRWLLTDSDNLYAENALRLASRVATGAAGSAAAARHARAIVQGLGVDPAGIVVADGSGLSRRNLVRPRQLAGLLAAMLRSPARDAFVQALPVAGRTGTLRTRLRSDPAGGRVRAKTGFIARVVCLSGYVERRDAEPLVFSAMLNDFTCSDDEAKAAVDAFVQRLAAVAGWDDDAPPHFPPAVDRDAPEAASRR